MESLGFRYADLERQGVGLAVHHAEVDYRSPALYDEVVVVRTTVQRVRSASVRFTYELTREADGTRLASGLTDLACLNLEGDERTVRPMPDTVRAALLEILGR